MVMQIKFANYYGMTYYHTGGDQKWQHQKLQLQ